MRGLRMVRDSAYHVLGQKHGSMDEVMQRQMNYRAGLVQRSMQGAIAAKAASGELGPAFGVTLEQWAAMNAALIQGVNLDDLLKGAGIDKARWDQARSEWEARMARDTTFAIAQVYGAAFQNASTGKYGTIAREATAARAANTELSSPPPMSLEQYYGIMFEQSYATAQGEDPAKVLASMGLSIVDWTDLSTYMGYFIHRSAGRNGQEQRDVFERVKKKYEAKYAGVKADVDIAF